LQPFLYLRKMIKNHYFYWILLLLSGLILLFIISPLLKLVVGSLFVSSDPLFNDPEVWQSIKRTLLISFITTIFFSIGAIPLAYLLARYNFWLKKLIIGIIDLPIVMPHTAAGIALLTIISPSTYVGKFLSSIGLTIIDSHLGIGLAMAFVSLPFLIQSARVGFSKIPVSLEKAALSLGASPVKVFFKISLPLAWQNIVTGYVLMFARGISEFGAVAIIAYHPMTSPLLLFERMNQFGLTYVQPIATVIIIISLVIFVLLRIIAKSSE